MLHLREKWGALMDARSLEIAELRRVALLAVADHTDAAAVAAVFAGSAEWHAAVLACLLAAPVFTVGHLADKISLARVRLRAYVSDDLAIRSRLRLLLLVLVLAMVLAGQRIFEPECGGAQTEAEAAGRDGPHRAAS